MHEAGIVQELLALADRQARTAGCSRVTRLVVRVGVFSSAVPEALEFAFAAMKPGTCAADARLEIERVPAAAWCARCQREFAADDVVLLCPQCGTISAELRRGFELELRSLDAE